MTKAQIIKVQLKNSSKKLRKDIREEQSIFEVDSKTIIPLFNVLHLFKGIINNVLKHQVSFIEDGVTKNAKCLFRKFEVNTKNY